MKRSSYREHDYAFGQMMLTLRSKIGLTQAGLADVLGISRRSIADWEAGSKYPKSEHLRLLITIAVQNQAFTNGQEADEIRALWKIAHQKLLLDEQWLANLLPAASGDTDFKTAPSAQKKHQADNKPPALNNLPFQPTPFVGRLTELSEIADLLRNPSCRLLNLVGPGGIGKTRLAIETASHQASAYADGVAFVALASVNDPSQIISAIGDVLHLSFTGQIDPEAYLLNYLSQRHMLLILDNLEHLMEGADLIHDVLSNAPRMTILVTSRERLQLSAEWLFEVDGLSYPLENLPDAAQTVENLATYGAVQLFIQRVRQSQPRMPLIQPTLTSIIEICQHVAGMPLAIELAAATAHNMPVVEIEQQIRANLDVLKTSFRDVSARHRSLRATFDYSWDLLNHDEQTLFSRLAVFRGGSTVNAAEQVAGADPVVLKALVNKSLLRQSSDLEPRFTLLEPLREYALEKLTDRGELEPLQQAHAYYFLAMAQAVPGQWGNPQESQITVLLDREYDNIRAVLQWARDTGELKFAFQLSMSLWRFWRRGGYISEGRRWLESLLTAETDTLDDSAMKAKLHIIEQAAWLAADQNDLKHARQLFEQAKSLRRRLGEPEDETALAVNEAFQARTAGEYDRAVAVLEDTIARQRALGSREARSLADMGLSLYTLGMILREQGDFQRSMFCFQEGIGLFREIGDREAVAQGWLGLSDIARDQGNAAQIHEFCKAAHPVFKEFGTQWAVGFTLINLGLAYYFEENLSEALSLVNEGTAVFRAIQNDGALAEGLVSLGMLLQIQGDIQEAFKVQLEALRLAFDAGPRLVVPMALEGIAIILALEGQAQFAVQLLAAASVLRAEMHTPIRPTNQSVLETTLTDARMSLGVSTFTAIVSEAEEIPLDQLLVSLLNMPVEDILKHQPLLESVLSMPHRDWNDAISIPTFWGREAELSLLTHWITEEHCRVISILGMGGIGKSALSVRLMHQVADQFEVVIWRSIRDLPSCDVLLNDLLQVVSPHTLVEANDSTEYRQSLLLNYFRSHRVLLVLDNLESALDESESAGRLQPEYEGLGRFLGKCAATVHQSCVLLTSREKLVALSPYEGSQEPVRTLRLPHLDTHACEQLLDERGIIGTRAERARLIDAYAGNPLALKIVSQTILDLFMGELTSFLQLGELIFGGIRELLSVQFKRLSKVEQSIILWLAIMREPTSLDELSTVRLVPMVGVQMLEAMEALHRRSLVERGHKPGTFTLQSVVLEYVTAHLIIEANTELQSGSFSHLAEYGFELAGVPEYVRRTQERLILTPILAYLHGSYPDSEAVEAMLIERLSELRNLSESDQGYAPANLITLLRVLRGHLRGLDLSRLSLRGLYLQGVDMQDTSLTEATIRESVFTETFDVPTAVAISSTGKYWAASSRSGQARVWAAGGMLLHQAWRAHADMIYALAFSPDGRTLATGSWDGAIKLWDVMSGILLWIGRHTSHAKSVAFSPDGSTLASSGNDAMIRIWDVRDGTQLHVLPHPVQLPVVVWSPDGRQLASGDMEGHIRLWELQKDGQALCVQTIMGHTNWVDGLAFADDGRTLASASWDNTVKLWNLEDGSLQRTLTGHTGRVTRVVWSPNGRILASSSRDHTIWLWDVEQGNYRAALLGHTEGVNAIAFTPDSRTLLSGGEDGTVRVWDIASGQSVRIIRGYTAALYDVDWSPDGTQLVSGGTDYLVTIYSATNAVLPRSLPGHKGVVFGVAWSSDGQWLASSEWDNVIRLWDANSGECVRILQHPQDPRNYFYRLSWSPDGKRLAGGTYRRGIQIFDTASGGYPWIGTEFPTWIRHVAWSPDGMQLAGGDDEGNIILWNAGDGTVLRKFSGHHSMITSVAWSPDGTRLASGSSGKEGGELFIWDIQSDTPLMAFTTHSGIVSGVAWCVHGDVLVSGDSDGTLRWWDIQRGECVMVQEAHQGTIHSLRRSPDGTKLASCGNDGVIILWDIESGEYLQTIRRDRPYERLNITGIKGLKDIEKAILHALGAVEENVKKFV